MKACLTVVQQLSPYMDGEVSPRQAGYIEAHLRHCDACRREWTRMNDVQALLETEPQEETVVELYPRFQQRLAEQRGRKRVVTGQHARRPIMVAAMIFVLVLAGSLLGTNVYQHRQALSFAHQWQPALCSSMAIAAESIQNDADADGLLNADPRLGSLIDENAHGETLEHVLAELANRTSISLAVSPDLANQRVYMRLRHLPIARALSEIRRLVSGAWEVTPGASGKYYTLVAPPDVLKIADAVASAQAMALAGSVLCGRQNSLSPQMNMHTAVFPTAGSDPSDQILRFLDTEATSILLAGNVYDKKYPEMSARQQGYFRSWVSNGKGAPDNRVWDEAQLNIALKREWDGTISLWFTIGGHRDFLRVINQYTDTEQIQLYNPYMEVKTMFQQDDWQIAGLGHWLSTGRVERLQAENAQYRNPVLTERLENDGGTLSMLDMLDLLARRTDFQVVADYFTVEEGQNYQLPRDLTLGELLAILDSDYNIAWSLDQQQTIRLVHRQWPMLRQTEPDPKIFSQLTHNLAQHGVLELEDLTALMRLRDLQYEGTIRAMHDEVLRDNLHAIRDQAGDMLQFYLQLTPAQQQAARSATGLSSTALTATQREQAFQLAQSRCEKVHGDARRPLIFSVTRLRTTWDELDKSDTLAGAPITWCGRCEEIDNHPVDKAAAYEILVLRWRGACEYACEIQLPTASTVKR